MNDTARKSKLLLHNLSLYSDICLEGWQVPL